MGDVLNIDVNTPIREQEVSTNLVILTLLGMLVVLTSLYAVLLRVAKAIFTKHDNSDIYGRSLEVKTS